MIGHLEITREIMGNVPSWMAIAFYALVSIACVWTVCRFVKRFVQYRRGRSNRPLATMEVSRTENPTLISRSASVVNYLVFHKRLMQDRYAGIAHILLFYGFVILFIGTCLVFLEHDTPLHFFYGWFYLVASLIIDLGGIAFLVGLTMFLYRRMFGNSKRVLRRFYVASLLWLLLLIGLTGFLLEGARIAVDLPAFERWSVAGYSIAFCLNSVGARGEVASELHTFLWGLHAAFCIVFFALLPWRFFSHIIFAPISWALRTNRSRSTLRPVNLNTASDATPIPVGATAWDDFAAIDLLQADACTTCGRCNSVCPAHAAEKPLRPRDIVLGIREAMNQSRLSLSELVEDDAIWSCTTCGACNRACPVGIEVYNKIIDLRRGKVESGSVPARSTNVLNSLIDRFNPYEKSNERRLDWAAGLELPIANNNESIELLYWIGCAGSFDPDGNKVSRAMVKILNHLGVNYRVLGLRERCNGDPARRMGEEGLFQELATANLELFAAHGVARILTHCPHCFNVFQNEYPQIANLAFTVEHHSQFLARMMESGKLTVSTEVKKKITYHDPCYLGRGNGETTAPRKVISGLPLVENTEMPRNRCNSSCCGAGGGSLWLDVKGKDRIENQRAKEAAETGANVVVTACPFCKSMLEAGRQSFDNQLDETIDLAELIQIAIGL